MAIIFWTINAFASKNSTKSKGLCSSCTRFGCSVEAKLSHAEQKFHKKRGDSQKFLDANASPKVIYSDNSLEFGEDCEDRGIIVHQRLIDRRQMVLQSGQYAG